MAVVADTERIRRLGTLLQQLSVDIDTLSVQVKGTKITPGSANPTATMLKEKYNGQVVNDGFTALVSLRKALFDMGTELFKAASAYDSAEDLNLDDAERLRNLVGAVQQYYARFDPYPTRTNV